MSRQHPCTTVRNPHRIVTGEPDAGKARTSGSGGGHREKDQHHAETSPGGLPRGLDRLPSRQFAINAAWVELALTAADLIAWTQHLLLHGHLAKAEPKTLRYRLLHVAARLTRGQRRCWLRIQRTWPWALNLAAAFARLTALPVPAG